MHSWHRPKLVLTISSSLPSFRVFWQLSWWRRTRHGHSWSFVDLFRLNWGIDFWAAFSLIICKMTFISRSSFKKHYIMTVSLFFCRNCCMEPENDGFQKESPIFRFHVKLWEGKWVKSALVLSNCCLRPWWVVQTKPARMSYWYHRQLSLGKALRTQVFAVVKPQAQWSL